MGRRRLLKPVEREKLFGIPDDETSLIQNYTLKPEDRIEIEKNRRSQNQLGFAVQPCLMRYQGRGLGPAEQPSKAAVAYIADRLEIGLAPIKWRDFLLNFYTTGEPYEQNQTPYIYGRF